MFIKNVSANVDKKTKYQKYFLGMKFINNRKCYLGFSLKITSTTLDFKGKSQVEDFYFIK